MIGRDRMAGTQECPPPEAWVELADPAVRPGLEAHLDSCEDCQELVGALARLGSESGAVVAELAGAGAKIGRYVIEGTIGSGGMGVVLAAFDPSLERSVALKLVRSGVADPMPRERLVAEAKAMARVAHPNVVTVYEVVEDDRDLFIAMERVDGVNLAAWSREPHTRAERVRVIREAGAGLAAIHAAGLIHRDIKPSNILVADRARITDFGLANSTNAFAGTPGYIAPEVLAGTAADARSDQYAFAITAREILGTVATTSTNDREVAETSRPGGRSQLRQPRRSPQPTTRSKASGALARVLDRAASADPADRYPDVPALLVAIDRAERRRWPFVAAGLAAAALAITAFALGSRGDAPSCKASPDEAGWTPIARMTTIARLTDRMAPTALALADDRTQAWSDAVIGACKAHERGADVSAQLSCLEDQRRELATAIDTNAAAPKLAAALAHVDPAQCAHAQTTTDVFEQARVGAELTAIADIAAHGDYKTARARVMPLTSTDPVLAARIAFRRADYTLRAGDPQAALALAHDAVAQAELAHDDAARLTALRVTISILDDLGRTNETRQLVPLLEAAAATRTPSPLERARLENVLGTVSETAGDYPAAEKHYRADLDALTEAFGGHPAPEIAGAYQNLASVLHNQGKVDEARQLFEKSAQMFVDTVGPDHPDLALALTGLGNIAQERDDYATAAGNYERVIQIRTRALGPDHPYLSEAYSLLAKVEVARGNTGEAQRLYRRAMEIATKGFGPNHPLTALAEGHLAELVADKREAIRLADAAVHAWDEAGASLPDADDARFFLAQRIYPDPRARTLAETARANYAKLPPEWRGTATDITAWLKAHP
ncbi:MAG: serine/threonine-protein kinase [Kofleriaceae bacterium]